MTKKPAHPGSEYFFFFFNFTILYWFFHISTWIRHRYTRVPHPEPSSLVPPHTIPLGRPSAPAPSIQYCASNIHDLNIEHPLHHFCLNMYVMLPPTPLPESKWQIISGNLFPLSLTSCSWFHPLDYISLPWNSPTTMPCVPTSHPHCHIFITVPAFSFLGPNKLIFPDHSLYDMVPKFVFLLTLSTLENKQPIW